MEKCLCEHGCDLDQNSLSINITDNILSVCTNVCACGSIDEEILINFCPMCGKELHEKQYAFSEAFVAYEEGKEIESCVSHERYSKIDDTDYYFNKFADDWFESINKIDMSEIRGKWYINEQ